MAFELPALPYARDALQPHISAETLDFHYGKHHQTYVDKLNGLLPGSEFEGKSLEEIIQGANGGMFNNAAQVWNHTFYWNSLSPIGGGEATGPIAEAITPVVIGFSGAWATGVLPFFRMLKATTESAFPVSGSTCRS